MSDCADMTTALARELTNGIKNEVEDLSAVFKKMAILKPVAEPVAVEAFEDEVAVSDIIPITDYTVTDVEVSEHQMEFVDYAPVVDESAISEKAPKSLSITAFIIDDTIDMTVFSTNAPAPAQALLPFVHSARPSRVARRDAMFVDESEVSLLGLYSEMAA